MPENISEKAIGYFLLIFGVGIILYSSISVYLVFTKKQSPVDLFSFSPITIDYSKFLEGAPKNMKLEQELISSKLLNEPLNYVAYLMLMGFMVTVGAKISTIGTTLVRPIKVNLKEEKIKT